MTSNRDRQRAAARARLERQMAQRAEAASNRRRRIQVILAGALAFVAIIAVAWIVIGVSGGDKKPGAQASPTPGPCEWGPWTAGDPNASPTPAASGASPAGSAASPAGSAGSPSAGSPSPSLPPEVKDMGKPPAGEPRSGVQLMTITTNLGVIKIQVETAKAPCAAASFTYLAGKKYFDNSKCHRLTTNTIYVLQCGDPSATGMGSPGYQYGEENLPTGRRPSYVEGTVALANRRQSDGTYKDTSGAQFFIVYKDTVLEPNYTILGHVLEGLEIIQEVAKAGVAGTDEAAANGDGAPKTEVKILSLTVAAPTTALPSPSPKPSPSPSVSGSANPSAAASASKSG